MLTGSWAIESGTAFNFIADYRKGPSISTRNALIGATTTSVKDIQSSMTDAQLQQLARDRTLSSAFTQLGITQRLTQQWQGGVDLRVTRTSGLPSSGQLDPNGLPLAPQGWIDGFASTGNEYSTSVQAIGSNLYSTEDTTTFGASYTTSALIKNGESMFVYNRNSWGRDVSLDLSWRLYRQGDNTGGNLQRNMPMVRVVYQVRNKLSLDADGGIEITQASGIYQSNKTIRQFFSLGFRWDL
jgi:hypothetical protein